MKYNYIIYETTINSSIIHSLEEIREVIEKPDLKYLKYRGQHKNGVVNIEDISYKGSGRKLNIIRKYFSRRDGIKYNKADVFNIEILKQGYKTQEEINMAEKEAIGNMVEDNEIAKDTTLNGNGGPGADGSLEDMFEEAPYGYHDEEETLAVGGAGKGPSYPDEPSVQFNGRHFMMNPSDSRFKGYDTRWWEPMLNEAKNLDATISTGGDFVIALIEHYFNGNKVKNTNGHSNNSNGDQTALQAVAETHKFLIDRLVG